MNKGFRLSKIMKNMDKNFGHCLFNGLELDLSFRIFLYKYLVPVASGGKSQVFVSLLCIL